MIKGQILENSLFDDFINKTIEEYSPKNIVEIGTWRGLGSTKRIIDAIINNDLDSNFISLETNKVFYDEAKQNLKEYINYVNLIYGRIIEIIDVKNFVLSQQLNHQEQGWLNEDIANFAMAPNVLSSIPEEIDFLLLDGGEFSTYSEWLKLKDRSKIIALDDTNTTKCRKIKQEILSEKNSTYDIIIDSNDRNGFMFLKKRQYL
jgi:hypothetical protein